MKHPASRITLVVAFILLISATLGHSNPSVVYLPVEEEAFLKSGYSNLSMHKAFALGPNAVSAWVSGSSTRSAAEHDAVNMCERKLRGTAYRRFKCELYAADERIIGAIPEPSLDSIPDLPDRPLQEPRYDLKPSGEVRGIVLILHGCDAGRLTNWEKAWVSSFRNRGFRVISPNSFAEKRPGAVCGQMADFSVIRQSSDIKRIRVGQTRRSLKVLRAKFPNLPIYVWGHSEGGSVAQLLQDRIDGLIVTGKSCGLLYEPINNVMLRTDSPVLFILGGKDPAVEGTGDDTAAKLLKRCSQVLQLKTWGVVFLKRANHWVNAGDRSVREGLDAFFGGQKFGLQPDDLQRMKAALSKDVGGMDINLLIQKLAALEPQIVKRWQEYLIVHGYYLGALDGKFGTNTKLAVETCWRDKDCWP